MGLFLELQESAAHSDSAQRALSGGREFGGRQLVMGKDPATEKG